MSDEHFAVDGALIEAWAVQKSLPPKDDDAGARKRTIFMANPQYRAHASNADSEAEHY